MKNHKTPREMYLDSKKKFEKKELRAIINQPDLSPVELWNLTPKNYQRWCNKHYYPKLLAYFDNHLQGFKDWKDEFDLDNTEIIRLGITDLISPKRVKGKKNLYITKAKSEKYASVFVATRKLKDGKNIFDEFTSYKIQKVFISFSDWCNKKGIDSKILNIRSRTAPGYNEEKVFLNGNFELLRMSGVKIPGDGVSLMDKGKHLKFVNLCSTSIAGRIYWGESSSLTCSYCAVDHLNMNNLEMGLPTFEFCSMEDINIHNSDIQQLIFYDCKLYGKITDSNLRIIDIYGGSFNPIIRNTHINKVDAFDIDYKKTYMQNIFKILKKMVLLTISCM